MKVTAASRLLRVFLPIRAILRCSWRVCRPIISRHADAKRLGTMCPPDKPECRSRETRQENDHVGTDGWVLAGLRCISQDERTSRYADRAGWLAGWLACYIKQSPEGSISML